MISQENGKCVAYTPCNKLTGLRGVFVGIGSRLYHQFANCSCWRCFDEVELLGLRN